MKDERQGRKGAARERERKRRGEREIEDKDSEAYERRERESGTDASYRKGIGSRAKSKTLKRSRMVDTAVRRGRDERRERERKREIQTNQKR